MDPSQRPPGRLTDFTWNGVVLSILPAVRLDIGEHGYYLLTQGLWKAMTWTLGSIQATTCAVISRRNTEAPCATPADTCTTEFSTCRHCGYGYCTHHASCHGRTYHIGPRNLELLRDMEAWYDDRAAGLITHLTPWRGYRERQRKQHGYAHMTREEMLEERRLAQDA